jgi:hypothetical protein
VKWAPNLAAFAAAFRFQGSDSESQVVESLAASFPTPALAIVSEYCGGANWPFTPFMGLAMIFSFC